MKPDSTAYSSVHKALTLLEAFIPDNEEISALEMSKAVGIHKSTTSRLLATLRDRGYLKQNPLNKKFTLGFKVKELDQALENTFDSRLVDFAKPFMDDLRNRLQESITLAIPADEGSFITHMSEGTGPLRLKAEIGTVNPYSTGAGGKVLLAFSPLDFQDKILRTDLPKCTSNSITDPVKLKAALSQIMQQGYAVDREENHLGIQAFAVPIAGQENKVIAALVVAGSSHTVCDDKVDYFIENLQDTAERISSALK